MNDDNEIILIKDALTKNVVYKCDRNCFNDSFYTMKDAHGLNK